MTQPNDNVLTTFYQCFQHHDPDGMAACYHPDVTFHDPVFQTLHGDAAGAMWHMLLGGNTGLDVTFSQVIITGSHGSARWEANYVFSSTGRRVHNIVTTQVRLLDGKIIEQRDTFSLWRWAGMALGLRGRLLGWTPLVQHAIRRQAQERLQHYVARSAATPKNSGYPDLRVDRPNFEGPDF